MRRDQNVQLGRWGEEWARLYLQACGYCCLASRFRKPEGEIDLIMRRGGTLLFVEVKTRRSDSCGRPEAAVTPVKLARMRGLASRFLQDRPQAGVREFRFDVVAIWFGGEGAGCRLWHFSGVG